MTEFTITKTITETYDPEFEISTIGENKYFLHWTGKKDGLTRRNFAYISTDLALNLINDGMKFTDHS